MMKFGEFYRHENDIVMFSSDVEDGTWPTTECWVYVVDQWFQPTMEPQKVFIEDLTPVPSDFFSYGNGI